jgi:hypothetical protein
MLLRLIPVLGAVAPPIGIAVMNDTGSDIMTLFTTDLPYFGPNIQGYHGWLQPTYTMDANGVVSVWPTILVQVCMARDDYTAWGNWIDEIAIVKPVAPNLPRLSGNGIRNELYFGTAPNNLRVAISKTKSGLTSLL